MGLPFAAAEQYGIANAQPDARAGAGRTEPAFRLHQIAVAGFAVAFFGDHPAGQHHGVPFAGRKAEQPGGRSIGDHPAMVQQHGPARQPQGVPGVMGDNNQRLAGLAVQVAQFILQLPAQLAIQCGKWLIQQQQFRFGCQGPGQGQPLLLATGQEGRFLARQPGQPDPFQQGHGPGHGAARGQGKLYVAQCGHVGEQGVVLEDQPGAALAWWQAEALLAVQPAAAKGMDLPPVSLDQARQQAQQGGFAAAGRAEQGQAFTPPDLQFNIQLQRAAGGVQLLAQVQPELVIGGHGLPLSFLPGEFRAGLYRVVRLRGRTPLEAPVFDTCRFFCGTMPGYVISRAGTVIDPDGFRPNVGIILSNDAGQVLWARRINQEAWQFPQGGIHDNESAEDALYRELNEEVGLEARDVRLIASTRGWLRYRLPPRLVRMDASPVCVGQKQKWFLLQLLADERRVRMDMTAQPEFDGWRWVSYWYPLGQVVSFKREVYRRALKELAPCLRVRNGNL